MFNPDLVVGAFFGAIEFGHLACSTSAKQRRLGLVFGVDKKTGNITGRWLSKLVITEVHNK